MIANPWKWYWSHDEERYQGQCDTRDQAYEEALASSDPGQTIHVLEATQGTLSAVIFHDLAERFDERNEDVADPDGYGICDALTNAQWSDLERRLTRAMEDWIKDHNLNRLAWGFGQTRNEERIVAPPVGSGQNLADAHSRNPPEG